MAFNEYTHEFVAERYCYKYQNISLMSEITTMVMWTELYVYVILYQDWTGIGPMPPAVASGLVLPHYGMFSGEDSHEFRNLTPTFLSWRTYLSRPIRFINHKGGMKCGPSHLSRLADRWSTFASAHHTSSPAHNEQTTDLYHQYRFTLPTQICHISLAVSSRNRKPSVSWRCAGLIATNADITADWWIRLTAESNTRLLD